MLEQFVTLIDLPSRHYQAMLAADMYAARPEAFLTIPMRLRVPELDLHFYPAAPFLVRKLVDDPDQFLGTILPVGYEPACLPCLLFDGNPTDMTVTYTSYAAERAMGRQICTKGETGASAPTSWMGKTAT